MKAFSDGLDLTKTGHERFIEAVNFKYSWFLIHTKNVEDETTGFNFEANAELIDIEEYKSSKYTGRAVYRVDRTANNVPYNYHIPNEKVFIERNIPIKQTTAGEIIEAYGGPYGVIILKDVPANTKNTHDLIPTLNATLTGLTFTKEDIVNLPIQASADCVVIRFHPLSLNYKGSFRVEIIRKMSL